MNAIELATFATQSAAAPRRFEARAKGAEALALDRASIGAAMERGLNLTLAQCNMAMVSQPAATADMPAQAMKDWHRGWDLSFQSPTGVVHQLRVAVDGTAQLIERATGQVRTLDLQRGQGSAPVAQLARDLGTSPTRLLRLCSVIAQTELANAETVIGGQSSLSRSFVEGSRVTPVGGESIRIQVKLGADGEDDRIDFTCMREGTGLKALNARDKTGDTHLIFLDTEHSFVFWQAEARVDGTGRATVNPADVRFDYTLVEDAEPLEKGAATRG